MTERRYTTSTKTSITSDPEYAAREDFDDDGRVSRMMQPHRIVAIVTTLVLVVLFVLERSSRTVTGTMPPQAAPLAAVPLVAREQDLQIPLKVAPIATPQPTLSQLTQMALLNRKCLALIKDARDLKYSGVVMETDPHAKAIIEHLQDELRRLLTMRFGPDPTILVEMVLTFPESMPDFQEKGADGRIVIEMAPIALVPYSVYNFLEIVRRFKKGAFHRNAGHVLQAMATMNKPVGETDKTTSFTMAFQEYDPGYPHKQYTLGYAGRPGGPAFYISTVDNTQNHGPASQGSKTEADACFGRLLDAESIAVAKRMQKQPGAAKGGGFISDGKNFVTIKSLKILSPSDAGAAIATVNVDNE